MTKDVKYEVKWVVGLFGTAVGAGILFLPISVGIGGIWPVMITVFLIFPMVWLSHRNLSRFVLSSHSKGNITEAANEVFHPLAARTFIFLYFFALYPICLAYGVGITNTVLDFMNQHLEITGTPRWVVSVIMVVLFMAPMLKGYNFMLHITQFLVFPLAFVLFAFSLYLIPHWQLSYFSHVPSLKSIIVTVCLMLPVLVFSFNHSPAISTFSVDAKTLFGEKNAEKVANRVLMHTAIVLTFFVMFFVISIVLTLSPEELLQARKMNISILSYFSDIHKDQFMLAYFGPIIAFTAISSSFFGHCLGANEGLVSMLKTYVMPKSSEKNVKIVSSLFISVSMIFVAIYDPSVLDFIETVGGPIIVLILFIMPLYAIYKNDKLKKYKNKKVDLFLIITGILSFSTIIYKMMF